MQRVFFPGLLALPLIFGGCSEPTEPLDVEQVRTGLAGTWKNGELRHYGYIIAFDGDERVTAWGTVGSTIPSGGRLSHVTIGRIKVPDDKVWVVPLIEGQFNNPHSGLSAIVDQRAGEGQIKFTQTIDAKKKRTEIALLFEGQAGSADFPTLEIYRTKDGSIELVGSGSQEKFLKISDDPYLLSDPNAAKMRFDELTNAQEK
jgi:hypothetical protein